MSCGVVDTFEMLFFGTLTLTAILVMLLAYTHYVLKKTAIDFMRHNMETAKRRGRDDE